MKDTKSSFNTGLQEKHDDEVMEMEYPTQNGGRRPAISPKTAMVVQKLLDQGFGYRKISRILKEEYGTRVDWSSVRNFKLGRSCYGSK